MPALLVLRYSFESSFRCASLLAGVGFTASASYGEPECSVLVDINLEMFFCFGCRIFFITFCAKLTSQSPE